MAHCVAPVLEAVGESRLRRTRSSLELPGVLLFTVLGFLAMGYHPGLEDDGIYLSAVKADLNPALFPHNADFFRLQMQATAFDGLMAHFVRWTHMPLAWAELVWQLVALFLILWAVKKIANLLFRDSSARWAAVAMVAGVFTLPVAGTALYMADQHLHPRTLATAMILLAVWRILNGSGRSNARARSRSIPRGLKPQSSLGSFGTTEVVPFRDTVYAASSRKHWQAAALLLVAFLMHPLMAAMGISFCCFLTVALMEQLHVRLRWLRSATFALVPLGWVFEPADATWRKALDTRTYYYLYQWTWYEWLGALAPMILFGLLWRFAHKRGETLLARFAAAVFFYALFQQVLAMAMLWPSSLVRLTPLQPMRYLHLEYFLFMMMAGAMLGRFVLQRSVGRWAVFLLAINGSMFLWQRAEFSGVEHLELPGRAPANPWLQAFAWIRVNTPESAYFALDPHYMEVPGEDFHEFRALAERSQLADAVKDAAVVTQVPELGPVWASQVTAEEGWRNFKLADFERLKAAFGVDWVLVAHPQPEGLACRWHNDSLAVCQIP